MQRLLELRNEKKAHELQSMITTESKKLLEDAVDLDQARALEQVVVVAPKLKTIARWPTPTGSASASEPAAGSHQLAAQGAESADHPTSAAASRNVSIVIYCGKAWQIKYPAKLVPPRSRTATWSAVRSHRACLVDCLSWA